VPMPTLPVLVTVSRATPKPWIVVLPVDEPLLDRPEKSSSLIPRVGRSGSKRLQPFCKSSECDYAQGQKAGA
jgi:hypothetical protein